MAITNLQIGLASWIIQDGNYGDFHVNQEVDFALEFYSESIQPAKSENMRCELVHPAVYSICARVALLHPQVWVIDFGLSAYEEARHPPNVQLHGWIEGEFYIGIDPFMYFERIYQMREMPLLTYRWRVEGIKLETTPWIEASSNIRIRDSSRLSYEDVAETNAWNDDGAHSHYILECECL